MSGVASDSGLGCENANDGPLIDGDRDRAADAIERFDAIDVEDAEISNRPGFLSSNRAANDVGSAVSSDGSAAAACWRKRHLLVRPVAIAEQQPAVAERAIARDREFDIRAGQAGDAVLRNRAFVSGPLGVRRRRDADFGRDDLGRHLHLRSADPRTRAAAAGVELQRAGEPHQHGLPFARSLLEHRQHVLLAVGRDRDELHEIGAAGRDLRLNRDVLAVQDRSASAGFSSIVTPV